jgi:hypothetical protein
MLGLGGQSALPQGVEDASLDRFQAVADIGKYGDEVAEAIEPGKTEEDVEALHIACAFDLKVMERRRNEVQQLVSMINEQLWVGHFDLWSAEQVVMFRHALLLSGGAQPGRGQCEMLLKAAIDACERHYQAFQFVLWAGKSARESLDSVLFETEGEA